MHERAKGMKWDFWPQWIRKGMTSLPSDHSLLDFILQVNARSDGELNVVMFWDSWMLISSSLTTRAMSLSSLPSLMMPSAMTANFTIPPKTMLRMVSTLGWAKSSLNIEFTWASFIQLLRSRKLGGFGPLRELMSYGAMSSPVPFTKQVVFPFSFMYSRSYLVPEFSIDAFFMCCPWQICLFISILNCPQSLAWYQN